jgi:hypothetical protein
MGIQTGAAVHSTRFAVPEDALAGEHRLRVVANGIASKAVTVTVTPAPRPVGPAPPAH